MKAKILAAIMVAVCVMASCSQDAGEEIVNSQLSIINSQEVTLTFSPYEVTQMSAPSRRAATNISNVVTYLDVWLVEGENVTEVHQSTASAGFGTITATLDKTKTYTLYAVGHKAGAAATLADGVISFPDDKVTHAMWYTTTFSPGTTTNLNCAMTRIVAQFTFNTTDQCPAAVTKMSFTITDVYDRWNVTTGGTHQLDRVATFDGFTKKADGTVGFSIYAITTDAQTTHDITVTAYDSDDNVKQQRTFADVPLRNGYKTIYSGTFFTDTPTSASFTINDWNEYEVVEF